MTLSVRYEAPDSIEQAIHLLRQARQPRLLAGGTDVLVQMRSRRIQPDVMIDIKKIRELSQIEVQADGLKIGAAVSCLALLDHPEFKNTYPGVAQAANLIGSFQVRGRATMTGNLCNASPAADSVPALIAAGAQAIIAGPNGRRQVPVEAIPQAPGQTSLADDELLVALFLPKPAPGNGMAYLRFTPRTEMDIAVVGAGVSLTLNAQGICTDAKVCLGAVAKTAIVLPEAAEILIGTTVDDAVLEMLALAARRAARPITDKRGTAAFRTKLAGVMAQRSARLALQRAQEKLNNG
ncbi:FAD binding domain-containing protein [Orrella sp. 11846]|uniref:FAD binding domain-containing protein n=1 Tax=Orrella sp. 11846 TaxID=3409913 RepID=UPI003B5A38C2